LLFVLFSRDIPFSSSFILAAVSVSRFVTVTTSNLNFEVLFPASIPVVTEFQDEDTVRRRRFFESRHDTIKLRLCLFYSELFSQQNKSGNMCVV
jgi:hypothetical protein